MTFTQAQSLKHAKIVSIYFPLCKCYASRRKDDIAHAVLATRRELPVRNYSLRNHRSTP